MNNIDEVIRPEDILGEVDFEIAPNAFSGPLRCPDCDSEMQITTAVKSFWSGKISLTYEIYECPVCAQRFFDGEQAKRKVALLLRALDEEAPSYEQEVYRSGDGLLISLPPDIMLPKADHLQATVRPLTKKEFLIHLHL